MRLLARVTLVVAVASVANLLLAAPAGAHVKFVSFAPSSPDPLEEPPKQAVLTFSTDVGDALREATITSPAGTTTQLEPRIDGARAVLPLPRKLYAGTWTVEWSFVGPDGHPQRDSRSFSIEEATPAVTSTFPADRWRDVSLVGRILFFSGLLLFVGGGIFALTAAQGFRPRGWGAMAASVAVGTVLVLAAHNATANRHSLSGLLDPRDWIEELVATGGRGYAIAAIAVIFAWRVGSPALAPDRWQRRGGGLPWGLVAVLLVAAVAPTLSSHAVASDAKLLRIPLDMVHLVAAATWIGGLAQLIALTVPSRARNPGIPAAIEVYSTFAFVAIVMLVLTGTFAVWTELDGDVGALVTESYGRLVLIKLGLLALTMPLAWANRQRHVPDVRQRGPIALPQLRTYVKYELAIAIWIVVATAALVHQSPSADHGAMHHAAPATHTT